jgi:membrane-bound serine protease (ClpP class)
VLVALIVILELLAPRSAEMAQTTIIMSTLAMLAIVCAISYKVVRARQIKVKTGPEAMMGVVGTVITALTPTGEIRIEGQIWRAKSIDTKAKDGEQVEIVGREGLTLRVKHCEGPLNYECC